MTHRLCPTCGKPIYSKKFKRHPECAYSNKKTTKKEDKLKNIAKYVEDIDDSLV
jgi:hypothetical protein